MDPRQPLDGKVAVVTGGTRGIGRGIAVALAEAGADVAVVSRTGRDAGDVLDAIAARGRRAVSRAYDLSDAGGIGELFDGLAAELGRLDVLVNNAGVQITGPAERVEPADWELTQAVNLRAPFFCAQALARHCIAAGRPGRIVNITSNAAVVGFPDFSAYAASKGGLVQLTRALAAEWGPHGINVNAVGTVLVVTEMTRHLLDDEAFRTRYLARIPSRRFSRVEDVAAAVVFLAGPGGEQIHGQQLMVDGGYTAV